jgi:hypothetical protein
MLTLFNINLYVTQKLEEQARSGSSAATVVVVIAPGTGRLGELLKLSERARRMGTRIATINYPRLARPTHSPLDALAHATGGLAFTVSERRYNEDFSYLSTYFDLTQALLSICNEFYQGDRANIPVEVKHLHNNWFNYVLWLLGI